MHKAVISQIKKRLNTLFETDTNFFVKLQAGKEFTANPITESSFTQIVSSDKHAGDFVAIDGGNNTLFASTTFSLHVIRVCAYKSAKEHIIHTFFLLVQQTKTDFEIDLIPADIASEEFLDEFDCPKMISLNDSEFARNGQQIEMQTLVSYVRRLLELTLAKSYDSVLIDGSLQAKYLAESNILKPYFENKKTILGVCKTTSLVTENGIPATLYVSRLAPFDKWFVSDVLSCSSYDVCFAKLARKSPYIFRVDVPQYVTKEDVLTQLSTISNDITFLGYPYVLIRADELARVSEDELQFMRNRFMSSLDSLTRSQLEQIRTTKSAHSVLDSMKF